MSIYQAAAIFFLLLMPLLGIYAAFLLGRFLYGKFAVQSTILAGILSISVSAIAAAVTTVTSGGIGAQLMFIDCALYSGIECGAAGWALFPYLMLCVPVGIGVGIATAFFLRTWEARRLAGIPLYTTRQTRQFWTIVALFLIGAVSLPLSSAGVSAAQQERKDQSDTAAEAIEARKSPTDFTCSGNKVILHVAADGSVIYTTPVGPRSPIDGQVIGSVASGHFVGDEYLGGFGTICRNSNGEDFGQKYK